MWQFPPNTSRDNVSSILDTCDKNAQSLIWKTPEVIKAFSRLNSKSRNDLNEFQIGCHGKITLQDRRCDAFQLVKYCICNLTNYEKSCPTYSEGI